MRNRNEPTEDPMLDYIIANWWQLLLAAHIGGAIVVIRWGNYDDFRLKASHAASAYLLAVIIYPPFLFLSNQSLLDSEKEQLKKIAEEK